MTGMGRPKHFLKPTGRGLLLFVAAIFVCMILADWLTGCADRRGDFAPDQIKWINRNVK